MSESIIRVLRLVAAGHCGGITLCAKVYDERLLKTSIENQCLFNIKSLNFAAECNKWRKLCRVEEISAV